MHPSFPSRRHHRNAPFTLATTSSARRARTTTPRAGSARRCSPRAPHLQPPCCSAPPHSRSSPSSRAAVPPQQQRRPRPAPARLCPSAATTCPRANSISSKAAAELHRRSTACAFALATEHWHYIISVANFCQAANPNPSRFGGSPRVASLLLGSLVCQVTSQTFQFRI